LITPKTSAILAVHVYGNPCNVAALGHISQQHGVRIIYDAAHAFGVELDGQAIASYGDISAFSFHATKLFHTIEGGALIVRDLNLKRRLDFLKNFGIADEETVVTPGINAKMNELQAAIGLLELKYVNTEIQKRNKIHHTYVKLLKTMPGIKLPEVPPNVKSNYAYFPILIDRTQAGISRDELYDFLRKFNVFPRKYFYPLCSNFPFFSSLPSASKEKLPIANKVAENILCLPMYGDLELENVEIICHIIKSLLCIHQF
jgi:dTDP-4-amino-4,6-dideoxygalactose transaminase